MKAMGWGKSGDCLQGGMGTLGSLLPKEGRQLALDMVLEVGELGRDTPHSHSPSFVLILELGTEAHRFPAKNPISLFEGPCTVVF